MELEHEELLTEAWEVTEQKVNSRATEAGGGRWVEMVWKKEEVEDEGMLLFNAGNPTSQMS